MMTSMIADLTAAQLSLPGGYINLFKLVAVLAMYVGWSYASQWVDNDDPIVEVERAFKAITID